MHVCERTLAFVDEASLTKNRRPHSTFLVHLIIHTDWSEQRKSGVCNNLIVDGQVEPGFHDTKDATVSKNPAGHGYTREIHELVVERANVQEVNVR